VTLRRGAFAARPPAFPPVSLRSWRQERSSIAHPTQQALMTLEWVARAENCWPCAGQRYGPKKPFLRGPRSLPSSRPGCASPGSPLESLTATVTRAKVDASVSR